MSLSFFLWCFPAEFSELCSLFSFHVQSLGQILLSFLRFCFFLFCVFGFLHCVCHAYFLVTVEPFPALLKFHTSSSDTSWYSCIVIASLQSYVSLLLLLVVLRLLWCWFLLVLLLLLLQFCVVAPPLFSPLRLLFPLIRRFVYSGSFCILSSSSTCFFQPSSAFFCMLQLWLLLPVFLLVFPRAVTLTTPSSLSLRY